MDLPPTRLGGASLGHRRVATNGIELHVVTAGPEDGPMVLLLHGFPEAWFGWERQIGPLAARGKLVVVPDLRGYNTSDKPPRVRDYAVDVLTADVLGLLDAFGRRTATIVCHDWGGVLGWRLAIEHPERVERFCAMNIAHPSVLLRASLTRPRQLARMWYVLALNLPSLPERTLARDRCDRLVRLMYANTVHKPFTADEIARYREAWEQPGALWSTLAWYRAALRHPRPLRSQRVTVPALIVWGRHDRAMGFELVAPSVALCDDAELVVIDDAAHFVQHDAPDRVNAALAAFIG